MSAMITSSKDAMLLEKAVELVARLKAEQTQQIGLRKMAIAAFLKGESLERAARQITARYVHTAGEIVRNVNRYFHCKCSVSFSA